MPELLSIATSAPDHCVTAADTKRYLSALLPRESVASFHRMIDGSRIQTRYGVMPMQKLLSLNTLEARNREYERHAVELGDAVTREALVAAGVDVRSIDAMICVSSSGYMMPSLDTHLIRRLGLRSTCRRIPLNQLGCAGGVAGVGLAAELVGVAPFSAVLIVSVELPSLSLQVAEPSPTDIISSIHFGDAAAAAVLSGRDRGRGPQVLATRTVLLAENTGGGVRLTESGLRAISSPGLHRLVRRRTSAIVGDFLRMHGTELRDISFWAVHPRTPQMLEAIGESLQLTEHALAPSWVVWERRGNVVSSSIFLILRELQESAPPPEGALGVLIAFGAGVTCDMALLRAGGWLSNASDTVYESD